MSVCRSSVHFLRILEISVTTKAESSARVFKSTFFEKARSLFQLEADRGGTIPVCLPPLVEHYSYKQVRHQGHLKAADP